MSGVEAVRIAAPAGGGAFASPRLALGVFLNAQPSHRLSLGGDRPRAFPLERHQGWIHPAGAEGVCAFDQPLDFVMIAFDDALLADAGLDDPGRVAPVVGALDPLVTQMALQAERFAEGGTLYRETMERAMAAHLAQTLSPRLASAPRIDDRRLLRAIDFIQAGLANDLSLTAMAATAGMSPAHFARTFKSATGASPLQYVIAQRIDRAQALLRTTRLPVAEIAYRVGYADLSRFGRHFKRRTGATPAAFRQLS